MPEPEETRPLPVLAEPRVLERPQPAPLPAVVVAGSIGFFAGVAAWMLVRVLRRPRRSASVKALRRRRDRGIEITGTRSFLVDVHLLKR
ncbi:MAG TPA: hypothetical protein VIJ36_05895 [Thermoanaerobaculia bacterium]